MRTTTIRTITTACFAAVLGTALGTTGLALADDMATPDEAKAMSEKAQNAVNELGAEAAFAAFAADDGGFQDKDLYVFCMDMDGVMLSHAVKPELVGKNLLDFNKYGDSCSRT
jgi:cytochrome c